MTAHIALDELFSRVMTLTRLPHAFGRYVLRERVATGGMAEVFRATLPGFGGFEKAVAIKRMYRQYGSDTSFVEMLTDEAKIVSQLAHPNIVQILDIGKVHNDYYIALEFIEGIDLFRLLQRQYEVGRDMPLAMALFVVAELCSALDYAHARRTPDGQLMHIIHRDVSPQNVLISHLGEVKLTDFGIAKARYRYTKTQAGVVKGKVYYMSPEQAVGSDLDHRSDLFAAGILLYELLCTRPLYDEEEQAKLISVVGSAKYSWPAEKRQKIPAQVIAITDRALHKNPGQRYQTGREFRGALLRVAGQLGYRTDREAFGAYVRKLFDVPDDRPPKVHSRSQIEATDDVALMHWASQIARLPVAPDADLPPTHSDAQEPDSELPTPAVGRDEQPKPGHLPRPGVIAPTLASRIPSAPVTAAPAMDLPPPLPAASTPSPSSSPAAPPSPSPSPAPTDPAPPSPSPSPSPSPTAVAAPSSEGAPAPAPEPVDEQEEATAMLSLAQIQAVLAEEQETPDAQEEPTAMMDLAAIEAALAEGAADAEGGGTTNPQKPGARSKEENRRVVPRRVSPHVSKTAKPQKPLISQGAAAVVAPINGAVTNDGRPYSHTAHAAPLPTSPPVHPDDEPASWSLIGVTAAVWAAVLVLAVYAVMLSGG